MVTYRDMMLSSCKGPAKGSKSESVSRSKNSERKPPARQLDRSTKVKQVRVYVGDPGRAQESHRRLRSTACGGAQY